MNRKDRSECAHVWWRVRSFTFTFTVLPREGCEFVFIGLLCIGLYMHVIMRTPWIWVVHNQCLRDLRSLCVAHIGFVQRFKATNVGWVRAIGIYCHVIRKDLIWCPFNFLPAICVSSRCLDVDDHKCPVLKCFWILRALPTAGSPWFKFPKAYKRGNIPPIYSFRIFFFFLLRSENLSSYSLSSWDFFPYFLIPFSYFTDVSRIFAETCWLLIAIQLSSLFCLISFLILWRNGDKCYPSKPKKL